MTWFNITNKAGIGQISIYDEIGAFGTSAAAFADQLKALGKVSRIDLSLNSPGGSVFDAYAIHNQLKRHAAKVYVTIDGIAASAASLVAMAGDHIEMPANAFLMVHNASGICAGTDADMLKMADALGKINASMIGVYASRTGLPADEVKALLDAETWLPADEAVRLGFADRMQPELKAAARFDLEAKFGKVPEPVKAISATTSTTAELRPIVEEFGKRKPLTAEEATQTEAEIRGKWNAFLKSHPLAAKRIVASIDRAESRQGFDEAQYAAEFSDLWNSAMKGETRRDLLPGTPEAAATAHLLSSDRIRPVPAWGGAVEMVNNRT